MKSEVIITESDLPQNVLRAIQDGRKIEAIKLLREATGLGLANAKVLVDRAARQHAPPPVYPSMGDPVSGLPRLVKSLIVTVLLFALYHYFVKS
jgi:hypothetical protein